MSPALISIERSGTNLIEENQIHLPPSRPFLPSSHNALETLRLGGLRHKLADVGAAAVAPGVQLNDRKVCAGGAGVH
jgi:hypothetical protein